MIETLHQKFNKMKREMKLLQESYGEGRRRCAELEKERDMERDKRERAERLNREVRHHRCCVSHRCLVAEQQRGGEGGAVRSQAGAAFQRGEGEEEPPGAGDPPREREEGPEESCGCQCGEGD